MGGSGSGGSSGEVDYPDYMKERHSVLFDRILSHVDEAIDNNPYVDVEVWSPESMVRAMNASLDYYDSVVQGFDPIDLWFNTMDLIPPKVFTLLEMAPLNDYIDAQKARIRHNFEDDILPKYRRGMQDIGAVMTSAFKIGEALLWTKQMEDEVELEKDYKAKLLLATYEYAFKSVNDVITLTLQKISMNKELLHYALEVERMGYTAWKEYTDSKTVYKVENVKWALEMHKYLMDALGSIAGSAGTSYSTSTAGGNKVGSAIGGALSGAASGLAATGGNPIGGAVGGAIGLVGGLLA